MHHPDKTHSRMSDELVRYYNSNPHNAKSDYTSPYKIMPDRNIDIILGGNRFVKSFTNGVGEYYCLATTAADESGSYLNSFATLHAEDGWVSLSMVLTDRQGKIILSVDHGEIISSSGVWDFHYEGSTITIRQGLGSILLDMDFSSDRCVIRKGLFLDSFLNGYIVNSKGLFPVVDDESSNCIQNSYAANGRGGFIICHEAHYPSPRTVNYPSGFGFMYWVPKV